MGKIKDAKRLARKLEGEDVDILMLCAWRAGNGDWRIQSRLPAVSNYLAKSLKLPRCAYAVLGGHLNIFRVTRRDPGSWATRFVTKHGGSVLT
jgi:hypothetical protein